MLDKFFRPRPVDLFGTNPGSSEKLRDVHIGRKVADRQAAGPCESHGEKEYYLCQIFGPWERWAKLSLLTLPWNARSNSKRQIRSVN